MKKTEDRRLEDKDWLYDQHVVLGKKIGDIAKEIGCSNTTIQKHLHKYEIPIQKNKWKYREEEYWQNKNWLEDQYIRQEKTIDEISDIIGYDRTTVNNWLNKFNIAKRKGGIRPGTVTAWNKGLTKETNKSLETIAQKQRENYRKAGRRPAPFRGRDECRTYCY